MLSIRDPPENERYTQMRNEEIENDISWKWKLKKKTWIAIDFMIMVSPLPGKYSNRL